jgi:hypothetical protein
MSDPVYNGNLWQGSVWRTGSGVPDPNLGVNGDFFLRTDTDQVYTRTPAGWVVTQDLTGYTGSRGDTGFIGSRGFTGSSGFTGSASTAQGPQGFTGSQGAGFTGSQGLRGFTGSVGFTGSLGFSGSRGFTGSASTVQGPIGFTGSQGIIGFTGSVPGPQGFTGSQGPIGFTGSVGFVGSSGTLFPSTSTNNVTGTFILDLATFRVFNITCTGSTTLTFINTPPPNQQFIAYIYVTNNGGTVTTWPTGTSWASGLAPTMTATVGRTDIITMLTINGGVTWYATVAGQNFA